MVHWEVLVGGQTLQLATAHARHVIVAVTVAVAFGHEATQSMGGLLYCKLVVWYCPGGHTLQLGAKFQSAPKPSGLPTAVVMLNMNGLANWLGLLSTMFLMRAVELPWLEERAASACCE